jgi:hypothetical protein
MRVYVIDERTNKARKMYLCSNCGCEIRKGEKYMRTYSKAENADARYHRFCKNCIDLFNKKYTSK